MTEKKASDLLQEIDEKLDKVLNLIQNLEFINKKMLQNYNELNLTKITIDKIKEEPSPPLPSELIEQNVSKQTSNLGVTKKVTVQQKILYSNDKPVVLAKVKIYNSDKKEIKELITNHSGKWTMTLEPGEYFIHVLKAPVSGKEKVDQYYPIMVPNTHSSLELNALKNK